MGVVLFALSLAGAAYAQETMKGEIAWCVCLLVPTIHFS
jgi:hypothetical protein